MCDYWNAQQKKKCPQCGIKKSFADALTGSWNPQQQESTSGTAYPCHMETDTESGISTGSNRASLVARIKEIDIALSALPDKDDFKEARQHLTLQKETVKKQIIEAKPMGARMDGCKAALERAVKRRHQAVEALEAAKAAVMEADRHVTSKEAELKQLEAEARASVLSEERPKGTCLDELENSMTKVLQEMEGSGHVQEMHLKEAYGSMSKLFVGLKGISRQAYAQSNTQKGPNILEMLGAVQAPVPVGVPMSAGPSDTQAKNGAAGAPNGGA